MQNIIMVLIPVLIGVCGQIFLKKGMLEVGSFKFDSMTINAMVPQFIKAFANLWVILGFALYFISSIFWMVVLSKVQLSVAYPLLSLGYIFVLLASWLLFKEPVTVIRWVGVLIIITGVSLISR